MLANQLRETEEKIDEVTARIEAAQKTDPLVKRLATIPGVGALTASAIAATTPEVDNSRSAEGFPTRALAQHRWRSGAIRPVLEILAWWKPRGSWSNLWGKYADG
ncbi:MAG: transposase [Roseovarius sp.]